MQWCKCAAYIKLKDTKKQKEKKHKKYPEFTIG